MIKRRNHIADATERSGLRRRAAVARAARATLERLEARQLYSGTPAVTISGPARVAEGATYPLTLSTANLTSPVDHWTVTWGDGQQSTAAAGATEADHVYADGPAAESITATATLVNGRVLTSNLTGAGVTSLGTADAAFGSAGQVTSGSTYAAVDGVAPLDNGQLIVAESLGANGTTSVLQRYNADGSLDTTFGTNGSLAIPNATGVVAVIDEHVADPYHPGYLAERLLVVGNVDTASYSNCHTTLWRFDLGSSASGLPDGTPDATFGTGGVVTLPGMLAAAAEGDNAFAATLSPSGQIVVAGLAWRGSGFESGGEYLAVSRLNANGSLDTTFNSTGQQAVTVGQFNLASTYPSLTPDGVAVASDGSVFASAAGGWVAKLTSAGAPSAGFGTAGVVNESPINGGRAAYFQSMALDASGNLLLGGALRTGSSYGWAVGRFSPSTGAIDTTYGANDSADQSAIAGVDGRLTDNDPDDGITSMVVDASGRLLVLAQQSPTVSASAWQMRVGRLNADGSPDTTFATGGFTSATFGGAASANAPLAVAADGKLVAAETYSVTAPSYQTRFGIERLGTTVPGTVTPVAAAVTNVAPTVAITAAPTGHVPEGTVVTLAAAATDPSPTDTAAGLPLAWTISRGGKAFASGTGSTFPFMPDDNGTYAVTVTATDKDGGVGSATTTVTADNVAPLPTIGNPLASTTEGTSISLGGSAVDPSSVDTAAGLKLAWTATKNGAPFVSATGAGFIFTPDDNGTYVVTLTATDKDGGSASTTDTIAVANVAPTPAITAPVSAGVEGTAIQLAGSATDPSPVDTAAGLSLGWAVTKNGAALATGSGPAYSFTPDDNGAYVVTLTATDKDGGSTSTTDAIAVANVPPTAALAVTSTARVEGSPISLSGSAADPSTADVAAGLSLGWAVTKNGAAFATGSGPAYSFTPDDNGTYAVTLTAGDKDGGRSTATTTLTVANAPPTAAITAPVTTAPEGASINLAGTATDPGAADVAAGLPLSWAVTKNGAAFATGTGPGFTFTPDDNGTYVVTLATTDKDGATGAVTDTVNVTNVAPTATIAVPVATSAEGTPITLSASATDPSPADTAAGLPLSWAVTKNGAAFTTGSGTGLTFTPDDNGTYVVTLTATDKDGGVGTTTDTVAVTNVAPTPTFVAPIATGAEGTPISLTGTATDPSTADTAAGLTLAWSATKNGAAYASGTGGTAAFTPNDNGTYVVTLTATDKDGGVGTTTDTVAVANVAPVATLTAPATANEGSSITVTGSATDASTVDTAAGLALSYAVTKNGSPFASSPTFVPDDNGTYVVTLTATDKDGGVGTTSRTVTVANVAPTPAVITPVTTAPEGSPINLGGTATDPSPVDTNAGFAYAWSVTKNGSPFATASGAALAFTPNDNGTYVATLTATDKDGGVGTTTDTVNVTNVAPTPTITAPVATGYTNVAVNLTGSATDPSSADAAAGLTLGWAVTKNGTAVGSAGSGGSYAFTPTSTGAYVVTLTATDKDGGTATTTDTVNVITAGYRLAGTNLMYNGTVEQTNVASFALRADGNAYYLTTAKAFGVNTFSTGVNGSLGQVYSYGLRSDGYAYYWSTADSRLYLNLPSQNIAVDNTPVLGFGLRSDGYGYFWDSGTKILTLNTPGFNVVVDNNPVSGFGMRSDGSAYFLDSVTKMLQVNTPAANYGIGNDPVQGFGVRADGSAYFWDASNGYVYINSAGGGTPGGTYAIAGSTAVSAFAADSNGVGYYVPVGTTQLRRNTAATDTLITTTYVAGTLKSAGPGPVSPVSYGTVVNGVTTSVTVPLT